MNVDLEKKGICALECITAQNLHCTLLFVICTVFVGFLSSKATFINLFTVLKIFC